MNVFWLWLIVLSLVESLYARPQVLFNNFVNFKKARKVNHTQWTSSKIIFPDEFELVPRITETPACSSNLTFCEEVKSYPYHRVKKALEKNGVPKVFFGKDELPKEELLAKRVDDDTRFVCRSMTKTVFPKAAQNKNNEWKYIINQGEQDGFIQGIQIDTCLQPNEPCDLPTGSQVLEFHSVCKQKFSYRRLLSINERGQPIAETFKIPSACCCSYKRKFEFFNRIRK